MVVEKCLDKKNTVLTVTWGCSSGWNDN